MESKLYRALTHMLNELESNQLCTVLAPSRRADRREWDSIRVNLSENCRWYKAYCAANISQRGTRHGKPDTAIKRRNTERALRRMLEGKYHGVYFEQLMEIARGIKL